MNKLIIVLVVFIFATPSFAAAYAISTPYWCGWGWSSAPCVNYTQPYSYGSYYYPANYSYSYNNYSYGYPCYPVSYDSRGNVVQTSCGMNYSYYNAYQYYPQYPSYQYRSYNYDRHDDRNWRDHERDDRDRNWRDHD